MGDLDHILSELEGRRLLVVGLARSGRAACQVLARRGVEVMATDRQAQIEGADALRAAGVELVLGADRPDLVAGAELVVLSPGVPFSSPMVQAAIAAGVPWIGELELAHRLASVPTLAVTGTNGKSTTTALCAHLLRTAGVNVFLGGNIGRPFCEVLLEDERPEWAVVEVSSFQLEHLSDSRAFTPQVGVWLNLTPDHLDRHGSMEAYGQIKRRLFLGQTAQAHGVFFGDDPLVRAASDGLEGRAHFFGRAEAGLAEADAFIDGATVHIAGRDYTLKNQSLAGDHNAENAAAALLAVTAVGIDPTAIQRGLNDFAGLPHRLELVGEVDGVRWINDSKGTNPDATAKSLTSFNGPIVLIAGGRGKGTGYSKLRQPVSERVDQLILIGEDADRLAADLDGCAQMQRAADLAAAVSLARRLAQPGGVVLLSPACASFDMFRDYEQRGDVFRDLVRQLGETS